MDYPRNTETLGRSEAETYDSGLAAGGGGRVGGLPPPLWYGVNAVGVLVFKVGFQDAVS